jgi:hypothetical protein
MPQSKIDLDRGTIRKRHPDGFRVTMYRDAPGEFYDNLGHPVEALAGFDTKVLLAEREKRRRIEEAKRRIESEFEQETQKIAEEVDGGAGAVDASAEKESGAADADADAAATDYEGPDVRIVRGSRRGLWNVVEVASGQVLKSDATRKEAEDFVAGRGEVEREAEVA